MLILGHLKLIYGSSNPLKIILHKSKMAVKISNVDFRSFEANGTYFNPLEFILHI